ncbi:MAG: peptidoglycan DD-metalloendopeptidase family protein [Candidatus Roseilinea sp.]|uniref:peptidoglycan DD-metalloendopeptidase family protein n=1 Tax=Candidatus Roseilinea sp. TaxID=2838777 RepID=UPI004049A5E9
MQRPNTLSLIRDSAQVIARARATRRLVRQYLRSEEIRWRLLVLIGRYTSHIAIVGVALLAVLLAGARLSNPTVAAGMPASGRLTTASLTEGDERRTDDQAGSDAMLSVSRMQIYAAINNQDGGLLSRLAVVDTARPTETRTGIITYTVQPGDTVEAIAVRFGLQPSTLVWSNEAVEETPDRLDIGQVLYVLPVDGIWYTVKEDDTLDSIASRFKAKVEDIIASPLNDLSGGSNLLPGQKIVIPRGVKPFVPRAVPQPNNTYADRTYTGPAPSVAASGTFQWPTNGYISQGYWWGHQAIDIANAIGVPIAASDSGYVSFAGWDNTGYGYMVMINHGNGFATVYAHLSAYYVDPGQPVSRGQIIAAMGSTGRSTGPHLHFEIRYGGVLQNPLYYLP